MGERNKCRTIGRNSSKPAFRRYWASGIYRKRRIRRIEQHIAWNPNDLVAAADLKRIEVAAYTRPDPMEFGLPMGAATKDKRKKR